MSYQIISKMAYNAKTREIEFWQKSNNESGRPYFSTIGTSDDELFKFIYLRAQNVWQGRKWAKQFAAVFAEFPELIEWRTVRDIPGTYDDHRYLEHLADLSAERNKYAIVARFRELTKIA